MELDIKLSEWHCPHCDEPGAEVTYIEVTNKEYERTTKGQWEWKFYPKARSITVWILFECGGETGYRLNAGSFDCQQIDGETDNNCPLRGA